MADLFIPTPSRTSRLGSIQPCCNYRAKTIHTHLSKSQVKMEDISELYLTRQSEMADPRSQWRICYVIADCFHHNARLTSRRILMSNMFLSCNDEEAFNTLLSQHPGRNPDHLRGRPGHGHRGPIYRLNFTPSFVKQIKSIGAICFELSGRAKKQKQKQPHKYVHTYALPSPPRAMLSIPNGTYRHPIQ